MHWMLMPLRRYAEFSGRSRRMEFWMWQLFKFLVGCALTILFVGVFGTALWSYDETRDMTAIFAAGAGIMVIWLLAMIFGLAIIIPDIAVAVRRLHDTNRSGWWLLAPLVPYLVAWTALASTIRLDQPPEPPTGIVAIIIFGGFALTALLAFLLLVFYFLDGTPGPNRFGPDPKGRG